MFSKIFKTSTVFAIVFTLITSTVQAAETVVKNDNITTTTITNEQGKITKIITVVIEDDITYTTTVTYGINGKILSTVTVAEIKENAHGILTETTEESQVLSTGSKIITITTKETDQDGTVTTQTIVIVTNPDGTTNKTVETVAQTQNADGTTDTTTTTTTTDAEGNTTEVTSSGTPEDGVIPEGVLVIPANQLVDNNDTNDAPIIPDSPNYQGTATN